jgi:hypothetical protein
MQKPNETKRQRTTQTWLNYLWKARRATRSKIKGISGGSRGSSWEGAAGHDELRWWTYDQTSRRNALPSKVSQYLDKILEQIRRRLVILLSHILPIDSFIHFTGTQLRSADISGAFICV